MLFSQILKLWLIIVYSWWLIAPTSARTIKKNNKKVRSIWWLIEFNSTRATKSKKFIFNLMTHRNQHQRGSSSRSSVALKNPTMIEIYRIATTFKNNKNKNIITYPANNLGLVSNDTRTISKWRYTNGTRPSAASLHLVPDVFTLPKMLLGVWAERFSMVKFFVCDRHICFIRLTCVSVCVQ